MKKKEGNSEISIVRGQVNLRPTNFAIIIDIKSLVDRIDHVLNFLHVARTQISVAFQHVFLCHFSVGTSSLEH